MIDIKTHIRKNILSLKPYASARDEFSGTEGIFLDANENPFGNLNRYPDPLQSELKKKISRLKAIPEQAIFLGNGSDEAIDLCFRIFCEPGEHKALLFTPTYGMYEVAAAIHNTEVIKVPLTDDFQIDLEKVKPVLNDKQLKLIFICSPNNPTGNHMREQDIDFILQNFNGIVILDEAYIDFSKRQSYLQKLSEFNNLIVIQTFSKAWGMAGARVGMAFAHEQIIGSMNKVKSPYNISALSQAAIRSRISDLTSFESGLHAVLAERELLSMRLKEVRSVKKVHPSDSNFILIEVEDADRVYQQLIDSKIVVRNRSNSIKNCLRITVGTPEENAELLNVFNQSM